jgi:hypothetical protein
VRFEGERNNSAKGIKKNASGFKNTEIVKVDAHLRKLFEVGSFCQTEIK